MLLSILNQIQPSKITKASYIFEVSPEVNGLYKYLAVLFGLLILAVILCWRFWKPTASNKKLRRSLINLLLTIGIIGLFLIFFRWQGIAYLGSRLMLVLLCGFAFFWFLFILSYRFRVLPKEVKKIKEKENFEKYLPKGRSRLY